jgi:cytochrome c biogenesis protein CcdA
MDEYLVLVLGAGTFGTVYGLLKQQGNYTAFLIAIQSNIGNGKPTIIQKEYTNTVHELKSKVVKYSPALAGITLGGIWAVLYFPAVKTFLTSITTLNLEQYGIVFNQLSKIMGSYFEKKL